MPDLRSRLRAAASVPLLALAACGELESEPPGIGRDLPENVAEATDAFDTRVQQAFPVGSDVQAMVSALKVQGFDDVEDWSSDFPEPSPYRDIRSMDFRTGSIFQTLWSVRWREDNGKITEIWGVYGISAP